MHYFNRHVYAFRPSGRALYIVKQTGKIVPIDPRGQRLEGMTNMGWSGRTEVVPFVGGHNSVASFDGRTLTIPLLNPPLAFVRVSR